MAKMTITVQKALDIFTAIGMINPREFENNKVSLLYVRLDPIRQEWLALQKQIESDTEAIRKPLAEELDKLNANATPEKKAENEKAINEKFLKQREQLQSFLAQSVKLAEEKEVDLPLFSFEEFDDLRKNSGFAKLEETSPLIILVELEEKESE